MSWALVLFLTPAAVILARAISSRAALLILVTIAGYLPFVMEAQVSFFRGLAILLFWTVLLSLLILRFSRAEPERMQNLIWRSNEYTSGMFRWIETGNLPEGSGRQVILSHVKQTLFYCILALFSANFLSLLLGSGLLNYMNYYVARLAGNSSHYSKALVMGWNPWSIVRVISFLWLGMLISAPTLGLLFAIPWQISFTLLIPPILGLILDLVLKLVLGRAWSAKLRRL